MGTRTSRRDLMAAAGVAALVSGCGGSDAEPPKQRRSAPSAAADVAIVRFLLSLEYLSTTYYERLAGERRLQSADRDLITDLRDDEKQHVKALEGLLRGLGGAPPEPPRPAVGALLRGRPDSILGRAAELEGLTAAAYLGQVPRVQDDDALDALLSIHTVEGRHAAALDHRLGRSFVPDGSMALPLDGARVHARLASFTSA